MKIAIAGYGVEGESSYAYWKKLGADITIFDEKEPSQPIPDGVKCYIGTDAFSKLSGFDLVVRTASLNPNKIQTDGKVWSATNEFFAKCRSEIIGVTGTKGKGTTCSLLAKILESVGKTVHLVGNIGTPALDALPSIQPEDIVVFELSSFQLWDLEKSPQTAVILMIEPDHMDIHASMEEYVAAKANIGLHQSAQNLMVYHPTNEYSATAATKSIARKVRYQTSEGARIHEGQIEISGQVICKTDEVGLIGAHNIENICAAITASWEYTDDTNAIKQAVISFKGLPHRLEFVRELEGVRYYNDSFSSAPGAAVAAIHAFSEPEIVVCGGFDRGLDYKQLVNAITEHHTVKKIVLIGQTAARINKLLIDAGVAESIISNEQPQTMEKILEIIRTVAKPGDVVVLSPGCPSFDMFKDFKDRGDQFKKLVEEL